MRREFESGLLKSRRTEDKRVQTEPISFRRPHSQGPIQLVVSIFVMIGHDRVGAGIEVRKFNDGHALCGPRCESFETACFIGE